MVLCAKGSNSPAHLPAKKDTHRVDTPEGHVRVGLPSRTQLAGAFDRVHGRDAVRRTELLEGIVALRFIRLLFLILYSAQSNPILTADPHSYPHPHPTHVSATLALPLRHAELQRTKRFEGIDVALKFHQSNATPEVGFSVLGVQRDAVVCIGLR